MTYLYLLHTADCLICVKGLPSMVVSEYGGMVHRLTECLRHFANMNVVGARRKHSGRSTKYRAKTRHPWRGRNGI